MFILYHPTFSDAEVATQTWSYLEARLDSDAPPVLKEKGWIGNKYDEPKML